MDEYKAPDPPQQSPGVVKLRGTAESPYDAPAFSILHTLGLPDILFPAIHQSTVLDWLRCPRRFMWKHRLGVRPRRAKLVRSLSVGHFFHVLMQSRTLSGSIDQGVVQCGHEIDETVASIPPDDLLAQDPGLLQGEMERQLQLTRTMAIVFGEYCPIDPLVIPQATELELSVRLRGMRVPIVGTLDGLVFDEEPSRCGWWIDEYKTTGRDTPMDRIATVSYEPQTLIYRMLVTAWLRQQGDTRPLRGIRHHVIQKPQIQFGLNDRDHTDVERPLKSGPRKGQMITERIYAEGPPKFENYLQRVREWYTATGTYSDSAEVVLASPRMVRCYTHFSGPVWGHELMAMLHEVHRASTAKVATSRFYKNCLGCKAYGRMCDYVGLCKMDPAGWRSKLEAEFETSRDTVEEPDDDPTQPTTA